MQGHDEARCALGLHVVDGKISVPRNSDISTFSRMDIPLGSVFDEGKWKMRNAFIFVPSGLQPNPSITENYYQNMGSVFSFIPQIF